MTISVANLVAGCLAACDQYVADVQANVFAATSPIATYEAAVDALYAQAFNYSSVTAWDIATSYSIDDLVYITSHGTQVYRSLTNTNVGNNPFGDATNWVMVTGTGAFANLNATQRAIEYMIYYMTEKLFIETVYTSGVVGDDLDRFRNTRSNAGQAIANFSDNIYNV